MSATALLAKQKAAEKAAEQIVEQKPVNLEELDKDQLIALAKALNFSCS